MQHGFPRETPLVICGMAPVRTHAATVTPTWAAGAMTSARARALPPSRVASSMTENGKMTRQTGVALNYRPHNVMFVTEPLRS